MAPNFSHLLKRPAGQARKPEALPIGQYPGIIKSYEIGDRNQNKTPYVRFHLALTDWPDGLSERDRTQPNTNGGRDPIDLTKRQPRRDFFLTEDAYWRLDDFLRSCQIDMDGREYEECIPEAVGKPVLVEIQQYLNEKTNEYGNQVGGLVGV